MALCVSSLSGEHSREAFDLKTHHHSEVPDSSTRDYYSEVPDHSVGDVTYPSTGEVPDPSTGEVPDHSTEEVPEPFTRDHHSEVPDSSAGDFYSEVPDPSSEEHLPNTSIAETTLSTRLRPPPSVAFRTAHARAPHPSFEQGLLSRLMRAFNSAKWMMTQRRRTASI